MDILKKQKKYKLIVNLSYYFGIFCSAIALLLLILCKVNIINDSYNDYYILTIFILNIVCLIIIFNCNLDEKDYLELLKLDSKYEEDYIYSIKRKYLRLSSKEEENTINYLEFIKSVLVNQSYIEEGHNYIKNKIWLLEIIKENNLFKFLMNKKEFKEYLSLFEKDYIEDYFKKEINDIKKELENINNFSIENVLQEKEKIKIISM